MANMSANQRAQYERAELGHASGDRLLSARSNRWPLVYMALMVPILACGVYAVAVGIDEWWQGLVLAVIVMTTVGLMIAISPNRRG
jgi:hypothetical protein